MLEQKNATPFQTLFRGAFSFARFYSKSHSVQYPLRFSAQWYLLTHLHNLLIFSYYQNIANSDVYSTVNQRIITLFIQKVQRRGVIRGEGRLFDNLQYIICSQESIYRCYGSRHSAPDRRYASVILAVTLWHLYLWNKAD